MMQHPATLTTAQANQALNGSTALTSPEAALLPPQQLMGIPPAEKRKKSAGEVAFDLSTYGGVSLLGNELLSMSIMKQAKEGALSRWFKPFTEWSKELPGLKKLEYVSTGRAAYLLWATIGGTMLVLPVKLLEDNKGKLVRYFDKMAHGPQAENDPDLKARHEQMEKAPKQTWVSLGEGRMITMGSALAVDSLIGWPAAPLAKMFDKPGKLNEYASFERLATTLSRNVVGKFSDEQKQINHAMKREMNVHLRFDTAKDTKAVQWLALGSSLLVLSTALTALFYASTKAFARGKEAKAQGRDAAAQAGPDQTSQADTSPSYSPATEAAPKAAAPAIPNTRVAEVVNMSRMSEPAMLQAGV